MGQWTVTTIQGAASPYNTGALFGNNVKVRFRLKYESSKFGRYKETPNLEWNEQIFMIEHDQNSWWEFETNMYDHNPLSKTLEVWAKRYVRAFDRAHGRETEPNVKGNSLLMTRTGGTVPANALGNATSGPEKADAVRNYLKRNGGILQLDIHDIPSINRPTGTTDKERLLIFNCGVAGGGPRFRGSQYLHVTAGTPPANWTRSWTTGQNGHFEFLRTLRNNRGIRKTGPPAAVSLTRTPVFFAGECK